LFLPLLARGGVGQLNPKAERTMRALHRSLVSNR
jgi:hypothetical protein